MDCLVVEGRELVLNGVNVCPETAHASIYAHAQTQTHLDLKKKMLFLGWTIDTPHYRVIAAINLSQFVIPSVISCAYSVANINTESKQC